MLGTPAIRYLVATQAITLIVAAWTWWRVWHCPCVLFLQDAAFWTAIVVSKAVVLLGLSVLLVPKE